MYSNKKLSIWILVTSLLQEEVCTEMIALKFLGIIFNMLA